MTYLGETIPKLGFGLMRLPKLEDGSILYGCELVGVAPVLSFIFEDYEKKLRDEGLLE